MSRTIRFPLLNDVPSVGKAETSLIITLFSEQTTLYKGGGNNGKVYIPITPWKTIQRQTESPFTCVAIEFTANDEVILGDGTFAQQIGLFGAIANEDGLLSKTLLGVLGIARGGVAPQVPLVAQTGTNAMIGYTQIVSNIAVYDRLTVGGVAGDIVLPNGISVTVKARPIRAREYLG